MIGQEGRLTWGGRTIGPDSDDQIDPGSQPRVRSRVRSQKLTERSARGRIGQPGHLGARPEFKNVQDARSTVVEKEIVPVRSFFGAGVIHQEVVQRSGLSRIQVQHLFHDATGLESGP